MPCHIIATGFLCPPASTKCVSRACFSTVGMASEFPHAFTVNKASREKTRNGLSCGRSAKMRAHRRVFDAITYNPHSSRAAGQ